MAWIDSKGQVSVGLYKTDPNPAEQARAMDGGAIFGVFEASNVTLDLRFKQSITRTDLASFESCHTTSGISTPESGCSTGTRSRRAAVRSRSAAT